MENLSIKVIQKTFHLQKDQQDCGVACLLSIIKYYGGDTSLENLRTISGTNIIGTTVLGLYQAANKLGFNAEGCEADMAALISHAEPLILHVIVENNLQHYVVCYSTTIEDGELKFIIGDPAKGIIYLTQSEVEKIWVSKTCITLSINKDFVKVTAIKNKKWNWIKEIIKEDSTILGIAAGLGAGTAVLGMAMAIFSQRLIDDILPKKDYFKLNTGIALVLILLLAKEGLSLLRQYFLLRQSKDFNIRIIDFFYKHLLRLPKPFFDTRKIGDLVARLNDTARIQKVISLIAGNVVLDILVTMVSFGFLFSYSWRVGVISLCVLPFYFILIRSQNKNITKGHRNIMTNYALSEANYISTLQGIEPIKNYNKQTQFAAENKSLFQNYQEAVFCLGKIQIKLSFIASVFGILFLIGILFFNAQQVLIGNLKTGQLIAILGICSSLLPSIANLALISIPINEAKIAFDRMFEFMAINPERTDFDFIVEDFTFLQVNQLLFRFEGRSPIIKNISLEIAKGEIIAIMGENGCGKSTFTQLLQKNYEPEAGSITINNRENISEISTKNWRKIIGVVPQNIHIFNGSVLENICFDDAQTKPQEVFKFLQEYGFAPFLDMLPQSVYTLVGEEGINLSGGQKQIIALARALYHKPQLLILDEATAAMDRESEQFVLKLITHLKRSMAIIFITHRLHVLKSFCDRIYILENGIVSTAGSHEKLIETQNLYSKYWKDLVS